MSLLYQMKWWLRVACRGKRVKFYFNNLCAYFISNFESGPSFVQSNRANFAADNARSRASQIMVQKLNALNCETSPSPPYSYPLKERLFENRANVEDVVKELINSRTSNFYRNGIGKLETCRIEWSLFWLQTLATEEFVFIWSWF